MITLLTTLVFASFVTPTPEPGTMVLVGGGVAAAVLLTRIKNRRDKK